MKPSQGVLCEGGLRGDGLPCASSKALRQPVRPKVFGLAVLGKHTEV